MGIRAVRTQDQDVMSSVMRRFLIDRVSPLVSLDRQSNPLAESTDSKNLSGLLEKFGTKVRDWLANLSSGEMTIADFNRKTVQTLDEICRDKNADGGLLRKLDKTVQDIRTEMDSTCARVRRLMNINGGPRPIENTELSSTDMALLILIERARQQISEAAPSEPTHVERPKILQMIKDAGNIPLKDHPKYGPMLEKFLGSKEITAENSPQMRKLFEIFADKPLGQKLGKIVLRETLGINDGTMNALINRVKEKKLYLNSRENPVVPGFFIRMAGREKKEAGSTALGHYCFELVGAVEE